MVLNTARGVARLGNLLGLGKLSSKSFNLSDIVLVHLAHALMVEIMKPHQNCPLNAVRSTLGAMRLRLKQFFGVIERRRAYDRCLDWLG